MKPNMKDSTQLLITFTTSMAAAIGSCAGATIWQSFGKPKVEEIAEKTGASTATISRVNRSLNYGNDGYRIVFERLEKDHEL